MDTPELKIDGKSVTSIEIDGKEVAQIEVDGKIIYKKSEPVLLDYFYIENVDEASGSISFERMTNKDIEYSTDGNEWTALDLTSGTASIGNVEPGAKVYLRGTNDAVGSSTTGKHISADFNHNIGGNICSMLDEENFESMTAIGSYAFTNLFYGDNKLISSAFNIGVVTSLGDYALNSTFVACDSMTTPPNLSTVTSIGSNTLNSTFYNCRNLNTAPDLSSIVTIRGIGNLAFGYTFYGCWKLQTIYAPNLSNWYEAKFKEWVYDAGYQVTNPQMIFQTQSLLDLCPTGNSGSGSYSKILAS